MDEEKSDSKGWAFYGTYAIIYAVLNIAAVFIKLLTTEWSVFVNYKEGDVFWVMVFGIAAALIQGIGPAIVFKRSGNVKLLYIFPLAVMLVSFTVVIFDLPLIQFIALFLIITLVIPLGFPLFNCFSVYNNEIWDNVWLMSVTPAVIYALVIFVTTLFLRRRQQSREKH
ncbi:MAG: hypothetical protein IJ760_02825 [Bacteroidales bacterium]|nr:hypothetical protein [Bacteroidales bacterium]